MAHRLTPLMLCTRQVASQHTPVIRMSFTDCLLAYSRRTLWLFFICFSSGTAS